MNTVEIIKELGIPEISNNRKYWLIRTNKGDYYDEFINMNYVAIGWNKLDKELLIDTPEVPLNIDSLKVHIKNFYPDQKVPGLVARHIYTFVNDMKKGDIVIIPSVNSKIISFGEILEDNIYYEKSDEDIEDKLEDLSAEQYVSIENTECEKEDSFDCIDSFESDKYCNYIKRRSIKWLKAEKRVHLDPKLFGALNSHIAICNITSYAPYIDRTLDFFFIKNNELHLLLNVTKKSGLSFNEYREFFNSINSILNNYSEQTNSNIDTNNLEIKTRIESPGIMEFISVLKDLPHSITASMFIGLFVIITIGFKMESKILNIEFNGVLKPLLDFLTKNKELENELTVNLKKLEIEEKRIQIKHRENRENEEKD